MKEYRFKALIFDMDGTLTRPTLDFQAIRRETGILSGDLAEEIPKRSPKEQKRVWAIIEAHEERAMKSQELQEGSRELLEECYKKAIKVGVVTRNAGRSVEHLCRKYELHFDAVVTREFPFLKPHPAPILHMLKKWQIDPESALMIGDYVHDMECGIAAGTKTCFFQNPGMPSYNKNADFVVSSMNNLGRIIFA